MRRSAPEPDEPGGLWVVSGPAGIGKTRLLHEIANDIGQPVAWGRSWDGGGAPAYWPWTQVMRNLLRRPHGVDLSELVLTEKTVDRFALFDGTVAALRNVAENKPHTVILDDLHEADEGTLLLTRFVARQLVDIPVLLLVASRPPADGEQSMTEHLGALQELGVPVDLHGLSADEIAELADGWIPAKELHAITGGNPFLVSQVVRYGLVSDEMDQGESGNVLRTVVRRRLVRHTPEERSVLAATALLGGDATHSSLAGALDLSATTVDSVLDGLVRDELAELDGGQVAVSHPLFGQVAADLLTTGEREAVHRRAASSLPSRDQPHARAYHLLRAGDAARAEAVEACLEAADAARDVFAHEESVWFLERAIANLGQAAPGPHREFELQLKLGRAYWRSNRSAESRAVFDRAWELASRTGTPEALAQAALGGGIAFEFSDVDRDDRVERVRAVLAGQPSHDSALRAQLLAALAMEHTSADDHRDGCRLAAEALAMARRAGSSHAIGHALVATQVTNLGPDSLPARLTSAREILALAERSGVADLELHGRNLLMAALLESGDIRGLDAVLADHNEVVDRLAEPRFARFGLHFRGMRATLNGRIAEAEQLALEAYHHAVAVDDAQDGLAIYVGQVAILRWLQGRWAENETLFAERRSAEPGEPMWTAALAHSYAMRGQLDAARGMLSHMPRADDLPPTMHWLLVTTMLADAAVQIGDRDRCEELRAALLPYADRMVPVALGSASWTVVARPLGQLAIETGRTDEGIRHLEHAVEVAARLGALPWLVEGQLCLAGALIDHGEAERARALLNEAGAQAEQLGLTWFGERVRDVRCRLPNGLDSTAEPGQAPGLTASDVGQSWAPRLSVMGTFEVVGTDARVATWKSRKARQLLKLLVARRGSPVPREQIMDMLWPDEDPSEVSNRLSVALSTVRRALDPVREHEPGRFVAADRSIIRIRTDTVAVDTERFLDAVERLRTPDERRATLKSCRGEALVDEPYSDWAAPLRRAVNNAVGDLARTVAAESEAAADFFGAAEAYRRLLDVDPYDEVGHLGIVRSLEAMGAHGHAMKAYETYRERCEELGIEPTARVE